MKFANLLLMTALVCGTWKLARSQEQPGDDAPAVSTFSPAALASAVRPNLASIEQWSSRPRTERRGIYTGVFVASRKIERSWILTVISDVSEDDSFRVTLGRTGTSASLIGFDPETHLALLEMDHSAERETVTFTNRSPTADQATLPLYLVEGGSPGNEPASAGCFACREPLRPLSPSFLRVHIPAREGSSGAPLFDSQQHLLGLIFSPVSGVAETFYALPSERIAKFLHDMRISGKPVDPWLGIKLDESITAPRILGRTENSPAHTAGLEAGDLVLSVGGSPVTCLQNLIDACSLMSPDVQVEIKVLRGREVKVLKITPKIRTGFSV